MFGFRSKAVAAALLAGALTLQAAYAKPPSYNAALVRPTPATTVFIYVDYVTGLDNLMTTIPGKQYRNNIAAFAKMAPLFKVDVALLGEESDYYGTFLPEIKALFAQGGKAFPRTTPTGYTKDLAAWLKKTGKRNVVIGGISIDNCTLHTALDLVRAGYNVYVVADVSSTNSKLAEDAALMRLIQAGAVPVSWLNILTELGGDFAGPYGKGMMEIIQKHWPASTVGAVQDTTPDGHGMQLPKN
jgi:hypothetical protein